MQNNEQGSEKLKEILEKINENGGPTVTEAADGGVEFDFPKELPKTALVFEQTDDAEADDEREEAEEAEFEQENSASDEGEEFSFVLENSAEGEALASEKPETDVAHDMIWKTYVPRFTEATERTYRFLDEDEYIERRRAAAVNVSVGAEKASAENSRITSATEEIDKEVTEDAVVVNVGGKDAHAHNGANTVNVFKFGEEKKSVAEKTPEELEKEEMDELFGRKSEPLPTSATEIDEIRDGESDESVPVWDEENGIFNIPDPVLPIEMGAKAEALSDSELPSGAAESVVTDNRGNSSDYIGKRDRFKDKFLDMLMATRLRLFVVITLGIALALFENLPAVAKMIADKLAADAAAVSVVIDVCMVSALVLMTIPEIIRAVAALGKKAVYPELFAIPVYLGYMVYSIAAIPFATEYHFLGLAVAVMAVYTVLSTYFVQSSDFRAFKLISEKGEKLVVDTRYTRTLDRENMALDGAVNEYKSKIARDFKTTFVSKFFTNAAKRRENTANNITVMLCISLVAIVVGIVGYFVKGGNLLSAFYGACLALCFGTPAFFVMSHKLPMYRLEKKLVERGSAVIGEGALYDGAEVDVIAFDDEEIFGDDDVAFKSVSLSDRSGDFRKAMRKMSSLFSAVGGPLCKVFERSLGKRCAAATSLIIEDDGISGVVDGVTVMAGGAEYMIRHGVRIPEPGAPTLESTKVMYGAEGDTVFAKFSIQYSFSEEFALMINSFIENGVTPLIYTREPNITNELVDFLVGGKCAIRVMKKKSVLPESRTVYKSLSSGIVTVGDKSDAVSALMSAKSYAALQSEIRIFELVVSLLGAVVAAALFAFDFDASKLSALLGAWHILIGIAFFAVSHRLFKGKRKGRKNERK